MFGQLLAAAMFAAVRVRPAVRAAAAQAHGDLLRFAAHRALQTSARLHAAGRILYIQAYAAKVKRMPAVTRTLAH